MIYLLSLLIGANALIPNGEVAQTAPNKTFMSTHYTFVPDENIYKFTRSYDIPVRDVNSVTTCRAKADKNVCCVCYNVRTLGEDTHDVVLVRDLGRNTYEVFPDTRQKVRDDLKCMRQACFKVPLGSISQYRILGESKLGKCWLSQPMKACSTKKCYSKRPKRVLQKPPKLSCFMGQCKDTHCCKPRNAQTLPKFEKTRSTHLLAEMIMSAQRMPAKKNCCSKSATKRVLQKPPKLSCFMGQCMDANCCKPNVQMVPSKTGSTHQLAEKIFSAQKLRTEKQCCTPDGECHSMPLFGAFEVLSSIPEDFRETMVPSKKGSTYQLAEKIFSAQKLRLRSFDFMFGTLFEVLSSIPEDFRETSKPVEQPFEIVECHIFNVGQKPQPTWRLVLVWVFWCFKIFLLVLLVRMCCCRPKVVIVRPQNTHNFTYAPSCPGNPGFTYNNDVVLPRVSGHGYGAYVYGAPDLSSESERTSNERM